MFTMTSSVGSSFSDESFDVVNSKFDETVAEMVRTETSGMVEMYDDNNKTIRKENVYLREEYKKIPREMKVIRFTV
jgi:hypothetical protein